MNNQLREVVISNVIGVVLIIAGILLNEWILSFLFSEDKELELLSKIIIWTFDILCLIAGILFLKLKNLPFLILSIIPIVQKKIQDDIFFRTMILILVLTPLVMYPLYRGIFSPYYEATDPDIYLISQALFYNAGMEPTYFDHPGYINYLIISVWIKFNYLFGLIPVSDMNQLFLYADENGFGAAMAPLVYSGRILAMILALIFLISFIYGVYRIYNNWTYSLITGLLLSSSTGLMIHSLILRTELLSAYFFMLFMFLIIFILMNDTININHLFFLGFFAYLSVMAKIQIMPGLLTAPLMILIFYKSNNNRVNNYDVYLKHWKPVIIMCAFISVPFLISIIKIYFAGQYSRTGDYELVTQEVDGAFHYLLIPLLLALYILIFKYIRKVSFQMTLVSTFMVLVGVASAYYLHIIWYDDRFVSNILFFYEKGKIFISGHGGITPDDINILKEFPEIIKGVIISKFNPNVYIGRPITMLYPFIFASIIYYYAKLGMKKPALRSLFLVLFAMGLEALFYTRNIGAPNGQLSNLVNSYPQPHYSIYIEFIVILSMIQLFSNYKIDRVVKNADGRKNIMFERRVIKTVASILIISVTVLNFYSNYRKIGNRQIGIAINLTPYDLVHCSRTYIYPLYEYFYEICGNDCDEFVMKGQ